MAMHLMAIAAATGYQMVQPAAGLPARGRVPALRAVATAPTIEPALLPPTNKKEMLAQAVGCIQRAREDGNNRYVLRLFLPRGAEEELVPCDESWEGAASANPNPNPSPSPNPNPNPTPNPNPPPNPNRNPNP